ncbi:hypothetical protein D1AOALGA4SA_3085 [Olavius algarvensis Delta 1 endosymbiont]|nr:hypothetical protein D1AOALGA4SA_3085 [Olavius algarvensis Delta 1 endosymbiont]
MGIKTAKMINSQITEAPKRLINPLKALHRQFQTAPEMHDTLLQLFKIKSGRINVKILIISA